MSGDQTTHRQELIERIVILEPIDLLMNPPDILFGVSKGGINSVQRSREAFVVGGGILCLGNYFNRKSSQGTPHLLFEIEIPEELYGEIEGDIPFLRSVLDAIEKCFP